jgi:hypothetical protein
MACDRSFISMGRISAPSFILYPVIAFIITTPAVQSQLSSPLYLYIERLYIVTSVKRLVKYHKFDTPKKNLLQYNC